MKITVNHSHDEPEVKFPMIKVGRERREEEEVSKHSFDMVESVRTSPVGPEEDPFIPF